MLLQMDSYRCGSCSWEYGLSAPIQPFFSFSTWDFVFVTCCAFRLSKTAERFSCVGSLYIHFGFVGCFCCWAPIDFYELLLGNRYVWHDLSLFRTEKQKNFKATLRLPNSHSQRSPTSASSACRVAEYHSRRVQQSCRTQELSSTKLGSVA